MRFLLSIDLNKSKRSIYTFSDSCLSKYLTIENQFTPDVNINLTTRYYERQKPGLIEHNWHNPFFNTDNYFIFIGGSVIYRHNQNYQKPVPSPEDLLHIILQSEDDHYKIIKGNYYIVLYDKKKMQIKLYSSPMFMHPAFFSFIDNHFIISNYLESFKFYFPLSVNIQGLAEYSLFDHCIHNHTLYNEIFSIQGGYLNIFQNNRHTEKIAYDIVQWYTPTPISKKKALPEIRRSLQKSIETWHQFTDKFNISLTGGFDGRLNFSFINPTEYSRLRAISYGIKNSSQLKVPNKISKRLGFDYSPIYFDEEFEKVYTEKGLETIALTCGISGFNRAVYPYAYNKIKNFSRSCVLGQCDMIRPLFTNPAGVIFNDFSKSVFFNDFDAFSKKVQDFKETTYFSNAIFTAEVIENIYNDILACYLTPYQSIDNKLKYYFFLLKESLMKYWHTEFHVVDIFIDDYVSFADLDYLEILFSSEYAGIYKGLFANNQLQRKSPHDLYVDLMSINNNKLNWFINDRNFYPGMLRYGKIGWLAAAILKKMSSIMTFQKNDTFNAEKWMTSFIQSENKNIICYNRFFNSKNIEKAIINKVSDSGDDYRLNRAISLKLWLQEINVI